MAVTGINFSSTALSRSTQTLTTQLASLQEQLTSGKKSGTYAGMGVNEGFAIAARAQLSNIGGFADTQTKVNTVIGAASAALTSLVSIGNAAKTAAANTSQTIGAAGQTVAQQSAYSQLSSMLGILNTQSGDRYIFSGSAIDTPSVASIDDIMNGKGGAAGLKQVIAERKAADLGADGLGRLVLAQPTSTSLSVAADAAGSPFGLKPSAISSTLTGVTVSGPAGSPAAVTADLSSVNAQDGESISLTFDLPDGSKESITLTASSKTPLPAGSFAIGATPGATAANLNAALNGAVGTLAKTSLTAASAIAASNDFFADPPQRVSGTPATATALAAGNATTTFQWYTGEAGAGSARTSATARIDQSVTVAYGARANEDAIRNQISALAAFAAVTTPATDANSAALVSALSSRTVNNLTAKTGVQTVADIQADFAAAQVTMNDAKARQTTAKSMLQSLVDSAETVSPSEIAAQILALQTSLQASYQTTSMLSQLSLVKFL